MQIATLVINGVTIVCLSHHLGIAGNDQEYAGDDQVD